MSHQWKKYKQQQRGLYLVEVIVKETTLGHLEVAPSTNSLRNGDIVIFATKYDTYEVVEFGPATRVQTATDAPDETEQKRGVGPHSEVSIICSTLLFGYLKDEGFEEGEGGLDLTHGAHWNHLFTVETNKVNSGIKEPLKEAFHDITSIVGSQGLRQAVEPRCRQRSPTHCQRFNVDHTTTRNGSRLERGDKTSSSHCPGR